MSTRPSEVEMIKASYEFEHGYARPVHRGIVLWNGSEDSISADNPKRSIEDLVYEMIGDNDPWSFGYDLKGVKVTIEIGEFAQQ